MQTFLVCVRGDAYRAKGLLTRAGIENVAEPQALSERVTARLASETADSAFERVRAALAGERFSVGGARPE